MDSYNKPVKRKGCFSYLITLTVGFIATLLLILIGVGYLLGMQYNQWRKAFELSRFEQHYLIPSTDNADSIHTSAQEKVTEYYNSLEDVDYVELTPNELVMLIHNDFAKDLPLGLEVSKYDIDTEDRDWKVYIQLKKDKLILPWLVIRIEKDNIQTAEVFVSEVLVGNLSLDDYGLGKVVEDINDGYREALITVNEGGLTGRKLTNIELEEDGVIIKGERVD